jgi:hypothetical protein
METRVLASAADADALLWEEARVTRPDRLAALKSGVRLAVVLVTLLVALAVGGSGTFHLPNHSLPSLPIKVVK